MDDKIKEKLKDLIKKVGFESVTKIVGSLDKTFEIFGIKKPMDFLNLFNDLESVQSEEYEDYVVYHYKKGHNFMIHNIENKYIYFNRDEIWLVLKNKFNLNKIEIQELTKIWLDETYNLREVTPTSCPIVNSF